MPFAPGKPKTGGRERGTPNRLTGTFRQAVLLAYGKMGGHDAFTVWAKQNKTEFYRIASRLIPVEIRGTSDTNIRVVIQTLPPTPHSPLTFSPVLDALPLRNDEPSHADAV